MANKASDVLKIIKEKEIEWVDLRFTDPKGKWQHLSMVAGVVGEDELNDGFMFDGSSIEGWKAINESDMILKPDLDAVWVDPFSATPMLILVCDIVEPSTGDLYSRDPRSTAKRAEAYLKSTGIGDTVYVGPEAEFFMFDNVQFDSTYNESYYKIDDIAHQDQHRRRREGIDPHRVQIRLEDHVGLVDGLPAFDRGTVEHEAVVQLVLADDSGNHRQMLPFALGIGEAKIDPLDLLVLDHLENVGRLVRHLKALPVKIRCGATTAR